jgi:LmbE family N-acetylglucosaminyl deacetylase
MLLLRPAQSLERLLVIGAHSDDIEIGCAGTILRLIGENPQLHVNWMVVSASGARRDEAQASAAALLSPIAQSRVMLHSFRDGFLPYEGAAVKEAFERQKLEFQPDLILTHYGRDAHQDHRLVAELTWNTFRDHLILEYEIPKYDGDFGSPNVFVQLDQQLVDRKIDHLIRCFPSQHGRRWFTADVFRSLLRLRGMECNAPSEYAEAFYTRKAVF